MENESLSHINCDGVLYYLDEKNINFLIREFYRLLNQGAFYVFIQSPKMITMYLTESK